MREYKIGERQYRLIASHLKDEDAWAICITIYRRVQFKRSKRVGWKSEGFAHCPELKGRRYPTRTDALKAGREAREKIGTRGG